MDWYKGIDMAFSPLRAKTHLKYAHRLLAEAMEAERLGHTAEVFQKCCDASEHAFKAIFNIAGIDIEKYKNLEEAVAKGLKIVFDKTTLDELKGYYSTVRSRETGQANRRESIEKASFIIKKAVELVGK